MAQKANQAIIGAFVLGAVLLAVAGVVVLGGGRFFRHTQTKAARSLRILADYLDRHPEAVVVGKRPERRR